MKRGLTALELLVVISILGVLVVIIGRSYYGYEQHNALKFSAPKVVGLLEEARNFTLSSKYDTQYGVHFDTTQVVLFEGATYSVGSSNNKVVKLANGVTITTVELNGGGNNVVFDRLTGGTSNYGTTTLSVTASTTATTQIVIYKTGLIESI